MRTWSAVTAVDRAHGNRARWIPSDSLESPPHAAALRFNFIREAQGLTARRIDPATGFKDEPEIT